MAETERRVAGRLSQLHWAAETARLAPSIFNTQPWRWRVSDDGLELWADRTRQLRTVDPGGRLLTISCGVALHHAHTALVAGGDDVVIERLPDPAHADLLARLVTPHSVGSAADGAQARFAAISLRHTDRRPFSDQPVADEVISRLCKAAEAQGAHLHILDHEDVAVLAAAASQAAEVELADPLYRDELRTWTGRPRWGGDGVPVSATTTPDTTDQPVPQRDFTPDAPRRPAPETDQPATGSAQHSATVYAVLWGSADDPQGWLRAGEALSAVMLDATTAGLVLSPMSDVIEVESARLRLRNLLARLGHPYLALRLGYPQPQRAAATPRRPASDLIQEMLVPPPPVDAAPRP